MQKTTTAPQRRFCIAPMMDGTDYLTDLPIKQGHFELSTYPM
jgi:hypothetical protein